MEEDCIGRQYPSQTVMLEEKEEDRKERGREEEKEDKIVYVQSYINLSTLLLYK
jgi:hypothetical protein